MTFNRNRAFILSLVSTRSDVVKINRNSRYTIQQSRGCTRGDPYPRLLNVVADITHNIANKMIEALSVPNG